MEWMRDVTARAAEDDLYAECLKKVSDLEPGFLVFRETLSAQHQELLDDYLNACEDLDGLLAQYAFHIGYEQAFREMHRTI